MRRWMILAAWAATAMLSQPAWAATYVLDADHTTVGFKIRHLFSYARGTFGQFEGQFEYEPGQPEAWKASAVIQAASIDTAVEKRDAHLRSPDFFDVEKFPTIAFVSTGVREVTETRATLDGNLTIHGVTKPVVLDLRVHGVGKDPWGNTRSGFTATTTINRKDFGLTWHKAVETGQLVVGEEVEITIDVEGMLKVL